MSRLDRDTDLSPLTVCTAGSIYVTEKRGYFRVSGEKFYLKHTAWCIRGLLFIRHAVVMSRPALS